MNYTDEQFDKAMQLLEARKESNLTTTRNRRIEAEKKCPQIADYQRIMRETGSGIAVAISLGNPESTAAQIQKLETENLNAQIQIETLLMKNGFAKDYLKPVYSCKKCNDTFVFNNKRCTCFFDMMKKVIADELNKSAPMTLSSFDSFQLSRYSDKENPANGLSPLDIMTHNYEYCVRYTEDFHLPVNGILMRGGTGLGKTHLSLAIARGVIDKGYSVIYGAVQTFFTGIELETFGREKSDKTMRALIEPDLLILDDLGAEFESKLNLTALYTILNSRMNKRLPTIVSTNLSASEAKQRYGDSVTSRLYSMEVLDFVGSDLRIQR